MSVDNHSHYYKPESQTQKTAQEDFQKISVAYIFRGQQSISVFISRFSVLSDSYSLCKTVIV